MAPPATVPRCDVLILTASIGAGHDVPAQVLADELGARPGGPSVHVADCLKLMGPIVERVILGGATFGSKWSDRIYDGEYWLFTHFAPARRLSGRLLQTLGGRGLRRAIAQASPRVIVSTYPGVTEVLGRMRVRGQIGVPIVSAITDLAALRYWSHPGVDLHLITHPESEPEVRAIAGPRTEIVAVRGLNSPAFVHLPSRAAARMALDLPATDPVVLVSGGGWGVGDLEGAVDVVRELPDAHAVVLCGNNAELRARLGERYAADARVRLLGFTDRMPELMCAADALVHSTAGLTVLEAIVCGLPAISFGWGRGHIRANNRAFQSLGLAAVAPDVPALRAALARALTQHPARDASWPALPTAAAVLIERFGLQ